MALPASAQSRNIVRLHGIHDDFLICFLLARLRLHHILAQRGIETAGRRSMNRSWVFTKAFEEYYPESRASIFSEAD